jgi:hypothetical protein
MTVGLAGEPQPASAVDDILQLESEALTLADSQGPKRRWPGCKTAPA